jgi:hypothetical protein
LAALIGTAIIMVVFLRTPSQTVSPRIALSLLAIFTQSGGRFTGPACPALVATTRAPASMTTSAS